VLDSQAGMGMGCVRVAERVLAAFGGLVEAPTRFEAGRDVSCGGVLWALRVASAIVCDGVSAAAVVFAPEYGNEDEHQI
jgi:hypothetical protein